MLWMFHIVVQIYDNIIAFKVENSYSEEEGQSSPAEVGQIPMQLWFGQ
jgi:hypothetical protein